MLRWEECTEPPQLGSAYAELIARDRWVCWKNVAGEKKPFKAARPLKPANAHSPANWSSHDEAMMSAFQECFDGIGFVLNGDGIVAIDLDDCIGEGGIHPAAMLIMQELGCGLIEISPSGTGLHGFGYGPNLKKGVRGRYKGIAIELYSDRRYMTVTGKVVVGNGMNSLHGFDRIAHAINGFLTEATETTESTESTESIAPHRFSSMEEFENIKLPLSCIPRQYGTRNGCIFRLASYLKSQYPTASADDLAPVFRRWHHLALEGIRTKDFEESWVDFKVAWKKCNHQFGSKLDSALSVLPDIPPQLLNPNYGERTLKLIRICLALQKQAESTPFFLGCRKAGELLGISHTNAANYLQMLADDGILKLISKGSGQLASRYEIYRV